MNYVFLYYYTIRTVTRFTSNLFSCVRFVKLKGSFMLVAWWVKLCQVGMFVIWMEKYQSDEPRRD